MRLFDLPISAYEVRKEAKRIVTIGRDLAYLNRLAGSVNREGEKRPRRPASPMIDELRIELQRVRSDRAAAARRGPVENHVRVAAELTRSGVVRHGGSRRAV
jgi:hypothetical protein